MKNSVRDSYVTLSQNDKNVLYMHQMSIERMNKQGNMNMMKQVGIENLRRNQMSDKFNDLFSNIFTQD